MNYPTLITIGAALLFIASTSSMGTVFLEKLRDELPKDKFTDKTIKRVRLKIYKSALSLSSIFIMFIYLLISCLAFFIWYSVVKEVLKSPIPNLWNWKYIIYPFIGILFSGQLSVMILSIKTHFEDLLKNHI